MNKRLIRATLIVAASLGAYSFYEVSNHHYDWFPVLLGCVGLTYSALRYGRRYWL